MIENKNFVLRKWTLDDSKLLAENANNIKIWNNVTDAFPYPYTEQDAIDYISSVMNEEKQLNFAIAINNNIIGGIGIVPRNDVYRVTAEIGYWLAEQYWGMGIMQKAVKEVTNHIFNNFEIIKIFAGVYEYNTQSMKVLDKAGFIKEAILKKGAVKNNKIVDLHYYSLFK